MLDYYIYVLQKVSFDKILFSIELKKALHDLTSIEIIVLENWFSVYTKDKEDLRHLAIYFSNIN